MQGYTENGVSRFEVSKIATINCAINKESITPYLSTFKLHVT